MRYSQSTIEKINLAVESGAEIVENANWRYTGRGHGYARVEKLAQTNNRYNGRPKRIVWACYK